MVRTNNSIDLKYVELSKPRIMEKIASIKKDFFSLSSSNLKSSKANSSQWQEK